MPEIVLHLWTKIYYINALLYFVPPCGPCKPKGCTTAALGDIISQMEDIALKVALVEQDGAPLPVYFLSWVQSTLLFMKLSGIPQQEVDKIPEEPFKDLDTFDLLQRARYYFRNDAYFSNNKQ